MILTMIYQHDINQGPDFEQHDLQYMNILWHQAQDICFPFNAKHWLGQEHNINTAISTITGPAAGSTFPTIMIRIPSSLI